MTWATVPPFAGNWNTAPPEKSIPSENPRTTMLSTLTVISTADSVYQSRRRATNSTWNSLR